MTFEELEDSVNKGMLEMYDISKETISIGTLLTLYYDKKVVDGATAEDLNHILSGIDDLIINCDCIESTIKELRKNYEEMKNELLDDKASYDEDNLDL